MRRRCELVTALAALAVTIAIPVAGATAPDESRLVCDALVETLELIAHERWKEARARMDRIDGLAADVQQLLGICPSPTGRSLNVHVNGRRWVVTVNLDAPDWWIGFGIDEQGAVSLPHVRAK